MPLGVLNCQFTQNQYNKAKILNFFRMSYEINKATKPLFIYEMANNHMGDVEHGKNIINTLGEINKKFPEFDFVIKFQYRQLDTFIHPDYADRMDLKFVKRFSETRLTAEQFLEMKAAAEKVGMITLTTPFDEGSVDWLVEHNYSIIKIASCSFTDWPLLEKIATINKPIIASTAGATLEEIDNVVSFFEHREKDFMLMHCVAEYPTLEENFQLNQIDVLQKRYPDVKIGYSTHEDPNNVEAVQIAIGKGVTVFEKHVGIANDTYSVNGYSAQPEQVEKWLESAKRAFTMCGKTDGKRCEFTEKEQQDLRALRRGVFASKDIKAGEVITLENAFFAMPSQDGQIIANEFSKYTQYTAEKDIKKNEPIKFENCKTEHIRGQVADIITQVKDILEKSHTVLPENVEFELSHHYGIDKFYDCGATIVNCINREYCKKLIIMVPNQKHPAHYHEKKEETFHILYGDLTVILDGEVYHYKKGDMVLVERGKRHAFSTKQGVVFEEISTTHYKNDSFYEDPQIMENKQRKNQLTYWKDI